MKKLAVISSLAVIVAGGAAAVPYYVGNKAERYITEPQTYEQGQVALRHRGESYERGYLSSRAQTRLTWQLEDEIIEFAATHEIDHAFTPRIVSRFRVLPGGGEVQQALHEIFGDEPLLMADTRLKAGRQQTEFHMPETRKRLDGGELHLAGLRGAFQVEGARLAGHVDVQPISFNGAVASAHVGAQRLELQASDRNDQLGPGSASYVMKSAQLRDADGESVALRDLRLRTSQTAVGTSIDSEVVIELAALETSAGSLENLSLRFTASNLHRELMELLLALDEQDEAERNLSPEVWQPPLRRFLENNPKARLDIVLGPETDAKASLGWELMYRQPDGMPLDLENPFELFAGLDTIATLAFTDEFIEELAVLLQEYWGSPEDVIAALSLLESNGFLVRNGQGYRVKLGWRQGDILVNDTPRPELAMMLGMLLASSMQ